MTEMLPSTVSGRDTAGGGRKLIVLLGDRVFEHALPEQGSVIIGRGPSADIRIEHQTLSRSHAKLTISAHVTIEDCGSRNGTVLGGRKLGTGEVVLVAPGAAIELGDALVLLRTATGAADLLGSSDGGERSALGRHSFERQLERIAKAPASLLLVGEGGVGKTFTAERVHALSARKSGPFLVLRCDPGLTADAIADAVRAAARGTLFIHEPSVLPLDRQSVLARSIASAAGAIRPMAATTVDLTELASKAAVSADLLYRISALTVLVPPLRARLRELPGIAEAIVTTLAAEQGRSPPLISADALAFLLKHTWPGNVRELKNALTQALVLGKGRVLTASHLSFLMEPATALTATLSSAVSELEHRRILEALRECQGNQSRAAKKLGISRGTLISRLERYAIPRPRK
jgi:DNA-binding NtrC family response regulator